MRQPRSQASCAHAAWKQGPKLKSTNLEDYEQSHMAFIMKLYVVGLLFHRVLITTTCSTTSDEYRLIPRTVEMVLGMSLVLCGG